MNTNDFDNNGIIKCSFDFTVKVYDYKDDFDYYEDYENEYSNDNSVDRNNYMIDPIYFYGLIIKKVDFGSTYTFIITHNKELLAKDDISFGSILYTFPKISFNNVELFDNNRAIILKLCDIKKDIIFHLPELYKDLDVNINDLKRFFSHKMLLRYEILKLQWELTKIIKNSDTVKSAKKVAHEEGNMEKLLNLRLEFFKMVK
jgi:hypothetical protein